MAREVQAAGDQSREAVGEGPCGDLSPQPLQDPNGPSLLWEGVSRLLGIPLTRVR